MGGGRRGEYAQLPQKETAAQMRHEMGAMADVAAALKLAGVKNATGASDDTTKAGYLKKISADIVHYVDKQTGERESVMIGLGATTHSTAAAKVSIRLSALARCFLLVLIAHVLLPQPHTCMPLRWCTLKQPWSV